MRKITHYAQSLLCALALFTSVDATAQNIFPTNGAVGLGTTNPMPNTSVGIGLHISRESRGTAGGGIGGAEFINCTSPLYANDFLKLVNISGGDDFGPALLGSKANRLNTPFPNLSRQALSLIGNIDNSHDFSGNTIPIMTFQAMKNLVHNVAAGQTVVNRPLFSWQNAGTTQMTMLANGNLGIGTTTPTEQLHTTAGIRFEGLDFRTNTPFVIGMDSTGKLWKTNNNQVYMPRPDTTVLIATQNTLKMPIIKNMQKYFVMADDKGNLYRVERSNINFSNGELISINTEASELYQNQPNPFRERTIIKFKIAKNTNSKMIIVYDMQGKQLRKVEILGDAQQVVFEANSISAGMYLYALIVNGKEVDTKRMIIMD